MYNKVSSFAALSRDPLILLPLISSGLLAIAWYGIEEDVQAWLAFLASLLLAMGVFALGSIQDAPLDVLGEGENPENPLATGKLDLKTARLASSLEISLALLFAALAGFPTFMWIVVMAGMGAIYFFRPLKVRTVPGIKYAGYSLLVTFFPVMAIGALGAGLTSDLYIPLLALASIAVVYYHLVQTSESGQAKASSFKLPNWLFFAFSLSAISFFFIFVFSHRFPAWTAAAIFLIFVVLSVSAFRQKNIFCPSLVIFFASNFLKAISIVLLALSILRLLIPNL